VVAGVRCGVVAGPAFIGNGGSALLGAGAMASGHHRGLVAAALGGSGHRRDGSGRRAQGGEDQGAAGVGHVLVPGGRSRSWCRRKIS
jgi:hypothetical protein